MRGGVGGVREGRRTMGRWLRRRRREEGAGKRLDCFVEMLLRISVRRRRARQHGWHLIRPYDRAGRVYVLLQRRPEEDWRRKMRSGC